MTCVGRLAVEGNLEAVLTRPLAGSKVLIGDGPQRAALAARAGTFSREVATSQFLAGLAPVPPALRARVAVSRSSAMIERIAARRHTTSQAGDAN
jgi:hypothetical protein